eukprot:CAMPEP_0179202990 /NCGR_PEP_ID=MMETSP0796-20121207/101144_1 /TAXON_ID=73915 /ORGANISM="Pyrodinium bahamense, Strain pbaha01" /LENGTH=195 /DNA_ID=CAMNT_0020907777 /DNA_START=27 /DNA_END=616 /DNA_ORIENTATION=+
MHAMHALTWYQDRFHALTVVEGTLILDSGLWVFSFGKLQWCISIGVGGVYVRAGRQQSYACVGLTFLRSPVQRRPALGVDRIHFRSFGEEVADALRGAELRGDHERRQVPVAFDDRWQRFSSGLRKPVFFFGGSASCRLTSLQASRRTSTPHFEFIVAHCILVREAPGASSAPKSALQLHSKLRPCPITRTTRTN